MANSAPLRDLRRRAQKGQAIVVVALMMIVLLGFVALAIDSARAYDGRRVLQDAVDAAALYAADVYQKDRSWTTAQTSGVSLFATDTRNSAGPACPTFPTPLIGAASITSTCTIGAATMTVTVADAGPSGQTFTYSAQQPLAVALIQVVGQSPTLTLSATATATASDQSLQPAIVTLSSAGCYGTPGASLMITGTSPLVAYGNVASNGAVSIDAASSLNAAGNVLTRCAPAGPTPPSYRCWHPPSPPSYPPAVSDTNPSGAACGTTGGLLGKGVIGFRSVDPSFPAPDLSGLTTPAFSPASSVIVNPGIYNTDPNAGGSGPVPCYFLTPGQYDFAGGFTVAAGMVSNELRPPDSVDKFWTGGTARCNGDFAANGVGTGTLAGTWGVYVTAIRTEMIGSVRYKRESAPSTCHQSASPLVNQNLRVVISNVPGAQGYNIYAANKDCTQPATAFGYLATVANDPATETYATTSGCPSVVQPSTGLCTLGQTTYDLDAGNPCLLTIPGPAIPPDICGALVPDSLTAPFNAGLPGQLPARAAPPRGDLANYNLCAGGGIWSPCPGSITPGAVQIYIPSGCLALGAGADSFLFSGAQYNWVLIHEPATNRCAANSVNSASNTAYVGMLYTPGAAFTFGSPRAMQTPDFGGIIADTVTISSAGLLSLGLNPNVAPAQPAVRLTG